MNNNYGFRETPNYRVLLELLEKNRENDTSSEDSAFDSDYDTRLDDSFNRMIKERNIKLEKPTFDQIASQFQMPVENSETPKRSRSVPELHQNFENESFVVDSPSFLPSSTICNKHENETTTFSENFGDEAMQQYATDIQQKHEDVNASTMQETFTIVAPDGPIHEVNLVDNFVDLLRNATNNIQRNYASFKENDRNNQSVRGFSEKMEQNQQDPLNLTYNENDDTTQAPNSTLLIPSQNISGGQGSSHNICDDADKIEESLNSTMNNKNDCSWTDCEESYYDISSSGNDSVIK